MLVFLHVFSEVAKVHLQSANLGQPFSLSFYSCILILCNGFEEMWPEAKTQMAVLCKQIQGFINRPQIINSPFILFHPLGKRHLIASKEKVPG